MLFGRMRVSSLPNMAVPKAVVERLVRLNFLEVRRARRPGALNALLTAGRTT